MSGCAARSLKRLSSPRRRGIRVTGRCRLGIPSIDALDTGSPGRRVRCRCIPIATPPRSRGAFRPSFAIRSRPRNQRAQGRPGARCTRGPVCNCTRECAHEHTGPAESIRPSLRNGFTAYVVISPVSRALLPPSPRELLRELGASFGRQNHTILPYARATRVRRNSASTASRSASVTIASAPLSEQDGRI